jgi:hypothetical protein
MTILSTPHGQIFELVMFDEPSTTKPVRFSTLPVIPARSRRPLTFSATDGILRRGETLVSRWDFGDNATTKTSMPYRVITHTYNRRGRIHNARVEVADTYMHTAVSEPVAVTVAGHIFLPLVLRSYPAP